MKSCIIIVLVAVLILFAVSCKTERKSGTADMKTSSVAPCFNADSAYLYIQEQVDFGARVPNTRQHVTCGEYLAGKLEEFGAVVTNQYADLEAYNGTVLKARNIVGSYNTDSNERILLFAHWDTRPWADNDPDPKHHYTPVPGANDGASGVGVLLEVARQIGKKAPEMGIDIIFFDAEDYGKHKRENNSGKGNGWGLGSQYWSERPHIEGYNARFGILLDMVGGKKATFYKEGYSEHYASDISKQVWDKAKELGYERFFVNKKRGYVVDDHLFVNQIGGIPSIDIVPYARFCRRSSFGKFWHTVNDDMHIIDKKTLKAVGQTVLEIIYNEKQTGL